ncbi:MAG: bifunctional 5,10-methylenetetrahydrofolate dehydrogenase/5,10-methenyltetrahydrofolate cyclohydrolase [Cytophagales bacterium]|nr:bifunctional 5,10-methylenetetrahydrofolate dehydrogenase/5,10-methenyltetrahydrofolate cyclohydrolase [Cytophagales bacterium]
MAKLLDGKKVSTKIKHDIQEKIHGLDNLAQRAPHLSVVQVGLDPASEIYVSAKIRDCEEVGMVADRIRLAPSISEEEVISKIEGLNRDEDIDGVIVQLPLPPHLSKNRILNAISPEKDVDGLHSLNFGKLGTHMQGFIPATPLGILELFKAYQIETKGQHVVVVGRSHLVGLAMSILLSRGDNPGDATVTLTHRYTRNLGRHTQTADIIVTAVGKPGLITGDMVKEGVVVVDVGIVRVSDKSRPSGYVLRGDADFESLQSKASYITPVPGGVGPMTRAALLQNTLQAAEQGVYKTNSSDA